MYFRLFRNTAIFASLYADSKSEVRFVPACQDFELHILAPFTNDGLAVICYITTVDLNDIEVSNDMQPRCNSKQQL